MSIDQQPQQQYHHQHEHFLRDAFGSPITDGACVLDQDKEVGYVRLASGPGMPGPDSMYWDGWFNVTKTRDEHPLRGKLLNGERVQLLGRSGQ
ncbi:hypothetical protein FB382_003400 [Nocardioides ginsengisegetis]|uniref:Uncharacterized protein n=1 Tax=Nocardioides ginsengisegetis TaxID=661491 RepID=A0A7W3PB56_9ACTN|nr:hypothetical protein [Nocardioides ginsengisegetis]MBA8805109.1 hypothetical protein [Nocardioides ginsengisegetis]